ncbi:MAG TPA: phosphoadenylyl-sulfate reductase [Roseiflexaceae bacterium]|nr:phosphoadenylyl-sulfate reductase [Roseiflexaceae bacterium]
MLARAVGDTSSAPAIQAEELTRINTSFRNRSAEDLLDWATARFGQQIVLTCSFSGASGMVLLDMIARIGCGTPVMFLDTDLLFPETYALAEEAARRYGVAIERRRPALTLAEQEIQEGPRLYERDPDRCCGIRKVAPLADALRPYAAWISGIRRDQSATRAGTELVQWNTRHNLLKIHPLAYWTERDVWRYIHAHQVPYNPLLDQGYSSIGCAPCTRKSGAGEDQRAGRWAGFAKTECGIHI